MMSLRTQRFLVLCLHLLALLLLSLHLYVRWLPSTPTAIPEPTSAEAAWWGLWPVTYVPGWAVCVATGLVLGTIVMLWIVDIRYWTFHVPRPIPNIGLPILIVIAALLSLAFFAFPIVHTRWGDAYILSNAIGWPDPALRLTHSWQAPLDVYLHSQGWLWLHKELEWSNATPVYRLLSPVAGIGYLGIVLALSRQETFAPGWLTFGFLTTLGLIQLFFGYIENYSFAVVGVLAYLWMSIQVIHTNQFLWLATLVLAITNATHPSTIILLPSLVYCGWSNYRNRQSTASMGNYSFLKSVFQIGLPMLAVLVLTVILMELGGHGIHALLTSDRPGGGDARWFVPLLETTTRWEYYTMFSWLHLRDFLNEQMLVAPAVLPSLVLIGSFWIFGDWGWGIRDWGLGRKTTQSPIPNPQITYFLLIAALSYLLFTWVWNPDYGGQRDWDLFSLAALPMTLLLIWLLPRVMSHRPLLVMGILPLILLQAAHTAAWIYQNRLPWSWP